MEQKKEDEAIVVNLIGAPGSGKSTLVAEIFQKLKYEQIDCEMALEYAKEKLWEGTLDQVSQLYIFARQEERLRTLRDKVDVIVTDAPHIHSFIYNGGETKEFDQLVKRTFLDQNNLNVLLFTPPKDRFYDPRGREQDKKESDKMQWKLKEICDNPEIVNGDYIQINPFSEDDSVGYVINSIKGQLK